VLQNALIKLPAGSGSLKKDFVLALSIVEILHFSIFWVVSMEMLIEEASKQQLIQLFLSFL